MEEGILCQGNIIKDDVEFSCTGLELVSYEARYQSPLGDQLTCIELGDDTFQYLVDNGGEDSFVIVGSKSAVDGRKFHDIWTGKNTACDVNHLQI